jgi:hypothetical protein
MRLLYFTTLLPIVSRGLLVWRFWGQMQDVLSEEEHDRESNRSLILAFAGFSFTGVTALIVLEPTVKQSVRGAVFFLLVSFLSYLWALNLQSYKATRWQGEAASALADVGSLSLVMALVSLLVTSAFGEMFVGGTALLAIGVWGMDHFTRLRLDWCYLRSLQKRAKGGNGGKENREGR